MEDKITEISCRICLESNPVSDLISPCKCTGSVQFAHIQCLKSWISSKFQDLQQAQCQICSFNFDMTFQIKKKCIFSKVIFPISPGCFVFPVLWLVQMLIGLLIYFIYTKYEQSDSTKQETTLLVMIGICSLTILVITIFQVVLVNKICLQNGFVNWKINEMSRQSQKEQSTFLEPRSGDMLLSQDRITISQQNMENDEDGGVQSEEEQEVPAQISFSQLSSFEIEIEENDQ